MFHLNIGGVFLSFYEQVQNTVKTWSAYDQVICMRFHALVLSILAGVPPVPIAYGLKTSCLARRCGLSDYLISWNPTIFGYFGGLKHTSSEEIIEKSKRVSDDSEAIQAMLNRNRKELNESAEKAFSLLMDCCLQ